MSVTLQGQVEQAPQDTSSFRDVDLPGGLQPANDMGHLDIQEVGCVQLLAGDQDPACHPLTRRSGQEEIEHGRRVDHDHHRPRASRTILAGEAFSLRRGSASRRSRISSRVG